MTSIYLHSFNAKSHRRGTHRGIEKKALFRHLHSRPWNYVKLNGKTTAIYRLADEGWRERSENSAQGETKRWLIEWRRKRRRRQEGIRRKRFAPLIIITRETENSCFYRLHHGQRVPTLLISLSPPFYTRWGNPWRPCLVRRPPLGSKRQWMGRDASKSPASWLADENLMNFDGLFLTLLSSCYCQRRGSQILS